MTRKESLAVLIAKVEAGTLTMWTDMTSAVGLHPDDRHVHGMNAYNGSIDAAKSLHEAVLPGWIWDVGPQNDAGQISACVTLRSDQSVQSCETVYHNPARAWLIAILRALHAQEADT